MLFRVRRYNPGSGDLDAMIGLVQAAWIPERRPNAYYYSGDLYWRLREPKYEQTLWLWEKQRKLAAFSELSFDAQNLEFQIHPDFAGSGLESEILAWAEAQAVAAPLDALSLNTFAFEEDTPLVDLLQARGYERQENYFNHHRRSLHTPLEEPVLPEGYTVRHLRGPEEWAARVAGHRAGWQSTKMTEAIYERMTHLDGYQADLDIVVVASDAPLTFVATCNCWLDSKSGVGLFEPVSTHPDHRRKGLGRALLLYGMEQLRRHDATSAAVCSASGNPASTRLYESCGMEVVRRDFAYRKQLAASGISWVITGSDLNPLALA